MGDNRRIRFTPMRIYLSYGHDSNEELVRRIKADLEKRGHDVWFDKNEIKFGDGWRRAITALSSPSPLGGERPDSKRCFGMCKATCPALRPAGAPDHHRRYTTGFRLVLPL